jgi:hypothetical protein
MAATTDIVAAQLALSKAVEECQRLEPGCLDDEQADLLWLYTEQAQSALTEAICGPSRTAIPANA